MVGIVCVKSVEIKRKNNKKWGFLWEKRKKYKGKDRIQMVSVDVKDAGR